ncbi:AMP-binding protein [Roseibium sp. MMSF_3412]|uniref:AMP-binding protein n=1 Tax=Roseibium sp. MMSF_3412 TaxID=3046712 RepID=UPI00273D8A28|nr:AMP-binding protein [Roseibium sp. MMSF_3412]
MAFVGQSLDAFAETRPDRTALKCGADRWSWRALLDAIGSMETVIRRATDRGGRVALLLDDPAALLICFFACARTGRIAMVLDPAWPGRQRADVLDEAAPDLVIDRQVYAAARARAPQKDIDRRSAGVTPLEDDAFYCGFTSGSTGRPKGYLRNHGSWLGSFDLSDREFRIPAGERIVVAGQLTHSLHLYGAVCGLERGHEVVLSPRFDPRTLLGDLSGCDRGSVLYATPTQLHFLAEAVERKGTSEAVHHILSSGAKWQDRDRQRLAGLFPNAQLIEFYGASETSFITVSRGGRTSPPGSVGKPPREVSVAIGDPETPLAHGTPGAIWVKSGLLFSGYLCGNDPQTRWKDGWLTFGDEGYLDAHGWLFLTGRTNRMIVTSGLNVYPEEIEDVLMTHPSVAGAVVAGLEDPVRGTRLEAAVQLQEPVDNAGDMLLAHCRQRLAAAKLPRRIRVFERLPQTAGGKLDIQRVTDMMVRGENLE